jgi:hypothetical protein
LFSFLSLLNNVIYANPVPVFIQAIYVNIDPVFIPALPIYVLYVLEFVEVVPVVIYVCIYDVLGTNWFVFTLALFLEPQRVSDITPSLTTLRCSCPQLGHLMM